MKLYTLAVIPNSNHRMAKIIEWIIDLAIVVKRDDKTSHAFLTSETVMIFKLKYPVQILTTEHEVESIDSLKEYVNSDKYRDDTKRQASPGLVINRYMNLFKSHR